MNRVELKAWRHARHVTQPQLAALLGVDRMTVWRWESGASTVPTFLNLALDQLDQRNDWSDNALADNRDRGYYVEDMLQETGR